MMHSSTDNHSLLVWFVCIEVIMMSSQSWPAKFHSIFSLSSHQPPFGVASNCQPLNAVTHVLTMEQTVRLMGSLENDRYCDTLCLAYHVSYRQVLVEDSLTRRTSENPQYFAHSLSTSSRMGY